MHSENYNDRFGRIKDYPGHMTEILFSTGNQCSLQTAKERDIRVKAPCAATVYKCILLPFFPYLRNKNYKDTVLLELKNCQCQK